MGFNDVMKKIYPFLSAGAALGGPIGVMAAAVVGKAIGADKTPTPTAEGVANAIASAIGTPEGRAAILQAERDFQAQMTEMGFKNAEDMEQIAASDRASARNMQVQTRSSIPGILAMAITAGFFGLLTINALHAPPAASEKVLDVMTGSLGTAWIMVIGYFFGSTAGSARKTELLSQAAALPTA